MFVPKEFSVKNKSEIDSFIGNHSFISLITNNGDLPIATHLPIIAKQYKENWIIEGHLALANPQSRAIKENFKALCILLGPHAYVSSSIYNHENVPTWNYQAVHLYGQLKALNSEELDQHLNELVTYFEKNRENPLNYNDFSLSMMESYKKEIVGFRLKVENIEAAFKLSQNRNDIDKKAIIADLEKCPFHGAQDVADAMKK